MKIKVQIFNNILIENQWSTNVWFVYYHLGTLYLQKVLNVHLNDTGSGGWGRDTTKLTMYWSLLKWGHWAYDSYTSLAPTFINVKNFP